MTTEEKLQLIADARKAFLEDLAMRLNDAKNLMALTFNELITQVIEEVERREKAQSETDKSSIV